MVIVETKNIYFNKHTWIMTDLELTNFTKVAKDSVDFTKNKGTTQLFPIQPNKIISVMFKGLLQHDDWAAFRRNTAFEQDLLLCLSARTVVVKQTQNEDRGQYHL